MSEAQVLEAVRALHAVTTDDEQRTAVSNYLSSFQRSVLSWNVSMNLLSRPGTVDSQLFAAQTLKEKLRGHSWQLSPDSWQPVRSCIVSVLQRPCEPALEIQVSLCLVALIILTTSEDVIAQLRQALPPSRTLLVLKLLGEEVESDTSPYEPAPGPIPLCYTSPCVPVQDLVSIIAAQSRPPCAACMHPKHAGVDKVAWWLQARRSVGGMAAMVLPFITECVSKPDAGALPSHEGNQQHAVEDTRRSFMQRSLACASAWFRLGVLFTLPSAAFECALSSMCTCSVHKRSCIASQPQHIRCIIPQTHLQSHCPSL